MAMQAAGYYTPMGAGPAPAAAPVQPQPVVVPVNNYSQNNTDAYIQSVSAAAPLGAGVMPGKTAVNGVREYKGWAIKAKGVAKSSRGMAMKAQAATNARSALFGSITGAIKSSLIFNGLFSLVTNGWKVYKHQETTADAGTNFAGDMTSAVVGGAAAGAATMAGTALLSGILGVGLPLTLAGMAIGAGAYFLADNLWKQTSIYNSIKAKVHRMLGGA